MPSINGAEICESPAMARREPARRGPRPALNIEEIVRAAIAIADKEGIEAVSMQRLGGIFGFTSMALYRYVPSKAQLVDLMIDTAIGPPPPLDEASSWRTRLEQWALGIFACFERHPWVLSATGVLRVMGPNELAWIDRALSALSAAGLSPHEQQDAFLVVSGHVRSVAQFAVPAPGAPAGISPHAWRTAAAASADATSDDLPWLKKALDAGAFEPRDDGLSHGLAIVLDGIAALARR